MTGSDAPSQSWAWVKVAAMEELGLTGSLGLEYVLLDLLMAEQGCQESTRLGIRESTCAR